MFHEPSSVPGTGKLPEELSVQMLAVKVLVVCVVKITMARSICVTSKESAAGDLKKSRLRYLTAGPEPCSMAESLLE